MCHAYKSLEGLLQRHSPDADVTIDSALRDTTATVRRLLARYWIAWPWQRCRIFASTFGTRRYSWPFLHRAASPASLGNIFYLLCLCP
jgi:hypothetical protein